MADLSPVSRSSPPDPVERAAAAAAAGLRRPVRPGTAEALDLLVADDPDPRVRVAALGALARLPDPPPDAWFRAAADPDPTVRRRAADLAPAFAGRVAASIPYPPNGDADTISHPPGGDADPPSLAPIDARPRPQAGARGGGIADGLLILLGDGEGAVAEAAAWALGELGEEAVAVDAVGRLAEVAGSHSDPLVREAAVAALGALGDPGGLDAVLAACGDKPAIRRRAVLALAAFEGPAVDAALETALADKDWQTRQAAEDLLG